MKGRNAPPALPPVFYLEHLPNHGFPNQGFSIYRGVLIQWDEDHDPRVLRFVDNLAPADRACLLIAQEHEGMIRLCWTHHIPHRYRTDELIDCAGDTWATESYLADGGAR